MKKLLSILLALGLVLGMVVAAVPAVADVTAVSVAADPRCESVKSQHTITFTPSAELQTGSNHIFIQFPAGTGFPEDLDDLDVTVGGIDVLDGEKWLVNATTLKIMVPALVVAAVPVAVVVSDVVNPPAGNYRWWVWTDRPADEEPVRSGLYRIYRTVSTYTFDVDFGFDPTASYPMAWDGSFLIDGDAVIVGAGDVYTGLATNFVPPFKACGQEDLGWEHPDGPRFTPFELTLRHAGAAGIGCRGHERAIVNFWLEDAPYGSTATLYLWGWDGDDIATLGWHEYALAFDDDTVYQWGYHGATPPGFPLAAIYNEQTPGMIHFDVVGDYEICFELENLLPDPCAPDPILTEVCISARAYQEKDSTTITLDPKWSLISLPMVPLDSSIESLFAPWMVAGAAGPFVGFTPWNFVKSIYHYDNLTDKWFFYSPSSGLPATHQQLNEMEDGKGYWVRTYTKAEFVQEWGPVFEIWFAVDPGLGAFYAGLNYDLEGPGSAHWIASPLWLFGTQDAQAPNPPLGYAVAEGWTMMGFTSLVSASTAAYLSPVAFDTVFGYVGGWQPNPANMDPGQGYWVYFNESGTVVPYP